MDDLIKMFDFSWPKKPLERFKEGAALGSITTLIVGAGLTTYLELSSGYNLSNQFKHSNRNGQTSKIERTIDGPIKERDNLNNEEVNKYLSKIVDTTSLKTKDSEYIAGQVNDPSYEKLLPDSSQNYLGRNLTRNEDSSNYVLTSSTRK